MDVIYLHKEYNEISKMNDIALVKLDEPVFFSKKVHPIFVPNKYQDLMYTKGTIVGFGSIDGTGGTHTILQKADIEIFDHSYCSEIYDDYDPQSMICAGLKEGGVDICFGDSGGALVAYPVTGKAILAGISSRG